MGALCALGLAACTDAPPADYGTAGSGTAADAAAEGPSDAELIALLDDATVVDRDFPAVSAAFELNGRATDLQRQRVKEALIGKAVEWDLVVYEVDLSGRNYKITSEPAPARHPGAASMLGVVAEVIPRDEADRKAIEALQTGDRVRLRGVVQNISLRVAVGMAPAVVVGQEG